MKGRKWDCECRIDGCNAPARVSMLCKKHYMRQLRTGNTEDREPVTLRKMKACSGCKERLPIESFFRDKSHQDGHTYYCKSCFTKTNRQYKYSLGMSVDDWLAKHGDRCCICSRELTYDTVNIDHDRKCCPGPRSCGKCVRGPLCRACNLGIANFSESVEHLMSAAIYLFQHAQGGEVK